MIARHLGLGLAALAAVVIGCSSGGDTTHDDASADKAKTTPKPTATAPSEKPPQDQPPSKAVAWEHPKVGAATATEEVPTDLGAGDLPPPSRGVRRMRIDTLQAAMTKVAGNDVLGNPIVWKYAGKEGFSDGAFGKALGRPDYQTSTDENGVTNALYLKFVGDAARDMCMQMAKNDLKRSDVATRALFPKAPVDGTATDAQIEANLQYLTLRFLGLRLDAGDPMLPALRGVYDAGVGAVAMPAGGDLTPAAEGWRGVCVALFESPLFHND